MTPQAMEHEKLRDWDRQTILSIFGVPPVVLGLETINYATAREQNRIFWETTVLPYLDFLRDEIQHKLIRRINSPDRELLLDFDITGVSALREDMDAKVERTLKLYEKGHRDLGFCRPTYRILQIVDTPHFAESPDGELVSDGHGQPGAVGMFGWLAFFPCVGVDHEFPLRCVGVFTIEHVDFPVIGAPDHQAAVVKVRVDLVHIGPKLLERALHRKGRFSRTARVVAESFGIVENWL